MTRPPTGLDADARLRHELVALLRGGQAHAGLHALDGIPPERVNERVDGLPHSLWDLLEHLRFSQADILEYAVDPGYQKKDWPDAYWPDWAAQPVEWDAALTNFRADRADDESFADWVHRAEEDLLKGDRVLEGADS